MCLKSTSDRHYAKASTQNPGAMIPMGGISGLSGISLASGSQSGVSGPTTNSRAFLLGAIPHITSLESFKGTGGHGLRVSHFRNAYAVALTWCYNHLACPLT